MDLTTVLDASHGIIERSVLLELGYSRRDIDQLISRGRLRAVARGLLASPGAEAAVMRAAALGARVGCVSAAQLRKMWVVDDGRFHVAVPANHSRLGRRPSDLAVHWTRRPLDGADLPAVESVRNMLLHLALCQPRDLAVAAFDSAVNKKLITTGELHRLAEVRGGRFAEVVELVDGRADSGIETLPRVRLGRRGIRCVPQVVIDGRKVDLLVGRWLVIQADGFDSHSEPVQHRRDLEQDRRLRLMGYTVLRYSYSDIMLRWAEVEAEILGAVAQGLHSAPHRARRERAGR